MKYKTGLKKALLLAVPVLILISIAALAGAQASYGGQQYYQPSPLSYYSGSISTYWPVFGQEECLARQDFIVQILPGGCSPQVVRSDLIEEQEVPIFCQLTGIKINPLIEVPEIKSIAFKGDAKPNEIAGIGFHPARAALKTWSSELVGSPIINNLGYLVVVLRRQRAENSTPEWVETNLTAIITYDAEKAFGVGRAGFKLPVIDNEEEWQQDYKQYSFWNGKAYIRNLEVGEDSTGKYSRLAIYTDSNQEIVSFTLHPGQSSQEIYLPGYYCAAGLKVNLNDIVYPETKVKLEVDDDEFWLSENQRFLDENCWIKKIAPNIIGGGTITVSCKDGGPYYLKLDPPEARIRVIDEDIDDTFEIGDKIIPDKNVILAYVGDTSDAASPTLKQQNKQFAVLIKWLKTPDKPLDESFYQNFAVTVKSMVEGPGKYNWKKLWKNVGMWLRTFGKETNYESILENVDGLTRGEVTLQERLKTLFSKNLEVLVLPQGEGRELKGDGSFIFEEIAGPTETNYEGVGELGQLLEEYYSKANSAYKEVANSYGNEKQYQEEGSESGEYYGAKALWEAAKLAAEMNKFQTQQELLTELIEKYPKSSLTENAMEDLRKLETEDVSDSSAFIHVAGETHFVSLKQVKEPGKDEKSVRLSIDGELRDYEEGSIISTKAQEQKNQTGKIVVNRILEESIEFSYEREEKTKTVNVEEGKTIPIVLSGDESVSITVNKINLKKEASLTITPLVARAETQANFTFKIGIEKRAIKLSPEKTQELIEGLDNSILQWEKIVGNLGNLVKTWKATCFAGSAFLLVKNFWSNLGGGGEARKDVMEKVWENECAEQVGLNKKYATMHACYYDHTDEIEKDIDKWQAIRKSAYDEDERIKKIEGVTTKEKGLLAKPVVNDENYIEESKSTLEKWDSVEISTGAEGEEAINSKDVTDKLDVLYKSGELPQGDVKDMMSDLRVVEACNKGISGLSDVFCKEYKKQVYSKFSAYKKALENPSYGKSIEGIPVLYTGEEKKQEKYINPIIASEDDIKDPKLANAELKKGEKIMEWAPLAGSSLFIVIGEKSDGTPKIDRAYNIGEGGVVGDKVDLSKEEYKDIMKEFNSYNLVMGGECNNKILETDHRVKYFENAPYKGMPAVLPIDLQEGWYVGVPPYNTIGATSEELNAYDESAMLKRFYICNAGSNGRIEFANSPKGDDGCCIQYFEGTGLKGATLSGKSESETMKLVRTAISSIMSAAQQYGKEYVTIPGISKTLKADVQPLLPAAECEEFMSASDCHTLFNLCDPVLCPASRCNFGGKYHVSDVVQSGVIGSILLCMPNYQENIWVPVCLTGVHAGLDNFVMIQKAVRDCLQESLKTGRNVGICDEIKSIYLCEFFWKQAAPLMKYGVPWLLEKTLGGIRGGGEYLQFQDSFNKLQQSVDYFTNYYGVNAFKAFQARTTEEVGTEVCQAWVSARYPSSADMLDKLLEPESPVQFYAHFSENVLTTATVPATSHYKVYFRIYSGKDQGIYYQVYLKRDPQAEIYQLPQIMQVPGAVGYISRGDQVDKAIDFTAPQGYKELCVRINGQEECGFGQVTTSFAMDELKNQYLAEQAAADVETEEECISGTASVMPLALSLNIQEGAEEALQAAIYKRGITRICASENPGSTTEPSRWSAIGYCDEAKKVRCWLDSQSVEDAITDLELQNLTLEAAKGKTAAIDAEGLWNRSDILAKLDEARSEAGKASEALKEIELKGKSAKDIDAEIMDSIKPAISIFEEIIKKAILNSYKAQAQISIAELYRETVTLLYSPLEEIEFEIGQVLKQGDYPGVDQEIKVTKVSTGAEGETKSYLAEAADDTLYQWIEGRWIKGVKEIKVEETGELPIDINLDRYEEGTITLAEGYLGILKLADEGFDISLDGMDVESLLLGIGSSTKISLTLGYEHLIFQGSTTQTKEKVLENQFAWRKIERNVDITGDGKDDAIVTIENADFKNKEVEVNIKKLGAGSAGQTTTGTAESLGCEQCGAGLINRCDRAECHSLGSCYLLFRGRIIYRCMECDESTACSDFEDYEECNSNQCGLDCAWVGSDTGNRCVPKYTNK